MFCDDLSFEPSDASYKALKVALDGSMAAQPATTLLIYATSNRRHLMPEFMQRKPATPSYDVRGRAASRRIGRGEDLAVRALRPVAVVLSVPAGRLPGDRRPLAGALRAATPTAIDAARAEALQFALAARFALRARGAAVRARLRRPARAWRRRDAARAGPRRGPSPRSPSASCCAPTARSCWPIGPPASLTTATGNFRAARSRPGSRSSTRWRANCPRNWASRCCESLPWAGHSTSTIRTPTCACIFAACCDWRGTPTPVEGQRLLFHRPGSPAPEPLLPAARPVMRWLGLPERLTWPPIWSMSGKDPGQFGLQFVVQVH